MIYITGDMHGELDRFDNRKLRKLKENDCLIVCGDFGFLWNDSEREKEILHKIGNKKFKTLFVDGTHENFELLQKYPVTELYGGKVQQLDGNLYHLMRGEIYTIDDKTVFAFGGGESQDKEIRRKSGTWWKEEQPSVEEMQYAIDNLDRHNRTVDYIVTHQPPAACMTIMNRRYSLNALTEFFEELRENLTYKKWYFGSLHQNKKLTKAQCLFTDIVKLS